MIQNILFKQLFHQITRFSLILFAERHQSNLTALNIRKSLRKEKFQILKNKLVMFISQPKILNSVRPQNKETQNIRSTKISENIRASQTSQKIRIPKLSSHSIQSSQKVSPQKLKSVESIYKQLHKYMQTVGQKINNLLQKQSNEYKVVYQHYYKKFKDQINQLKEKTIQQQKKFLQNDHVHCIQSEIKILRQEVVAYRHSYEKMKKQNQQLKVALDFFKQDVIFLENNVKNRIKEIKLLTAENTQLQAQINKKSFNQALQSSQIKTYNPKDSKKRSYSMNIDSLSKPQIKVQFHKYKPNPMFKQLSSNRNIYQEYFLADQSTKDNKTGSLRSFAQKSNNSIKDKIQYTNNNSFFKDKKLFRTQVSEKAQKSSKIFDICQWFLDCVETVKKQIFLRKSESNAYQIDRMNNGFKYLDSLSNFKKQDKIQILKIFLSNEEIIFTFYHLLKNQKKIELQNQKNQRLIQKSKNSHQEKQRSEDEDFQARFTNLELRKNTKRSTNNQNMTQISFFDWNLVEKAQKFQNLSQFSTTTALNHTNLHSSKPNKKRAHKTPQQKRGIQLDINPKNIEQQKNIKMMKKITAIINKKKNIPLSSQLFVKKKNFIIE